MQGPMQISYLHTKMMTRHLTSRCYRCAFESLQSVQYCAEIAAVSTRMHTRTRTHALEYAVHAHAQASKCSCTCTRARTLLAHAQAQTQSTYTHSVHGMCARTCMQTHVHTLTYTLTYTLACLHARPTHSYMNRNWNYNRCCCADLCVSCRSLAMIMFRATDTTQGDGHDPM
jgi:hypothetical protein